MECSIGDWFLTTFSCVLPPEVRSEMRDGVVRPGDDTLRGGPVGSSRLADCRAQETRPLPGCSPPPF